MANNSNSGCGCLLVIILAVWLGGGIWQGAVVLAGGWLAILAFIGVSAGIVLAIVKLIAGK